jgi:hypothetical protein
VVGAAHADAEGDDAVSGATEAVTRQEQLSAVGGLPESEAKRRLMLVRWAGQRDEAGNVVGRPGLHDLDGFVRTALVNDLARYNIAVEMRLKSLELMHRTVPKHADKDYLPILGPGPAAWMPQSMPLVEYQITDRWQKVPVTLANWVDYVRSTTPDLGGACRRRRKSEVEDDDGRMVVRRRWVNLPAVDLFDFRLPGDTVPQLVGAGGGTLHIPVHDPAVQRLLAQVKAQNEQIAQLRRAVLGGDAPAESFTVDEDVVEQTRLVEVAAAASAVPQRLPSDEVEEPESYAVEHSRMPAPSGVMSQRGVDLGSRAEVATERGEYRVDPETKKIDEDAAGGDVLNKRRGPDGRFRPLGGEE